jgi:hypothetical protein
MMMRSQSKAQYAPMDQGAESGWRSHDGEPQQQASPTRPKSGGHDITSAPSVADVQPQPDKMPTYRPLEPGEMPESVPVAEAEPQQAQKMQSQSEAVKNAPASQPQAVTGQRWQGGYLPPRPVYGYGYPPPGRVYPPRGYGYGYPPRPYGYPAQSAPAPKSAESRQSSTRAPQ